MCAAQKSNIGWAAVATQGKWLVVVKLETRAFATTLAGRIDERAAVSIPLGDRSFHGCGNVTRTR